MRGSEVSEPWLVYRSPPHSASAGLRQVMSAVGKRWGELFAQEPREKAHKACRGGSGLCIYLCHTHSKEEACCQGRYLPLLLYSELPPAKTPRNAKASPSECALVFLCFEVYILPLCFNYVRIKTKR